MIGYRIPIDQSPYTDLCYENKNGLCLARFNGRVDKFDTVKVTRLTKNDKLRKRRIMVLQSGKSLTFSVSTSGKMFKYVFNYTLRIEHAQPFS